MGASPSLHLAPSSDFSPPRIAGGFYVARGAEEAAAIEARIDAFCAARWRPNEAEAALFTALVDFSKRNEAGAGGGGAGNDDELLRLRLLLEERSGLSRKALASACEVAAAVRESAGERKTDAEAVRAHAYLLLRLVELQFGGLSASPANVVAHAFTNMAGTLSLQGLVFDSQVRELRRTLAPLRDAHLACTTNIVHFARVFRLALDAQKQSLERMRRQLQAPQAQQALQPQQRLRAQSSAAGARSRSPSPPATPQSHDAEVKQLSAQHEQRRVARGLAEAFIVRRVFGGRASAHSVVSLACSRVLSHVAFCFADADVAAGRPAAVPAGGTGIDDAYSTGGTGAGACFLDAEAFITACNLAVLLAAGFEAPLEFAHGPLPEWLWLCVGAGGAVDRAVETAGLAGLLLPRVGVAAAGASAGSLGSEATAVSLYNPLREPADLESLCDEWRRDAIGRAKRFGAYVSAWREVQKARPEDKREYAHKPPCCARCGAAPVTPAAPAAPAAPVTSAAPTAPTAATTPTAPAATTPTPAPGVQRNDAEPPPSFSWLPTAAGTRFASSVFNELCFVPARGAGSDLVSQGAFLRYAAFHLRLPEAYARQAFAMADLGEDGGLDLLEFQVAHALLMAPLMGAAPLPRYLPADLAPLSLRAQAEEFNLRSRAVSSVFISYRWVSGAVDSRPYARMLATELRKRSYAVWLDVDNLNAGSIPEQIVPRVRECHAFVPIWAAGCYHRCAAPDDAVRLEVETARAKQRSRGAEAYPIVPFILDGFFDDKSKYFAAGELPGAAWPCPLRGELLPAVAAAGAAAGAAAIPEPAGPCSFQGLRRGAVRAHLVEQHGRTAREAEALLGAESTQPRFRAELDMLRARSAAEVAAAAAADAAAATAAAPSAAAAAAPARLTEGLALARSKDAALDKAVKRLAVAQLLQLGKGGGDAAELAAADKEAVAAADAYAARELPESFGQDFLKMIGIMSSHTFGASSFDALHAKLQGWQHS